MNNIAFKNIQPQLQIGSNCFYMNVSGILEYKSALPLALTYTYIDFIYNLDNFLSFVTDDPPEKYISPDNDLILVGAIGSIFRDDYNSYINRKLGELMPFEVKEISYSNDLLKLKTDYLDKNNPLIFPNDLYYVYDDYIKNKIKILLYHISIHEAVLVDINFNRGTCSIIDKSFSFVGEVSIENYLKSVTSPFLNDRKSFMTIELKNELDLNAEENIKKYLKNNIEFTFEEEVEIDGRHYHKGIKALELFIEDYDLIAEGMIRLKGKYAPQFINNMLLNSAMQRISYYNLIKYLQTTISIEGLTELVDELEKLSRLWDILDPLFDKCYISGNNLISYKHKLLGIFNKILEQEKQISETLTKIKCKL